MNELYKVFYDWIDFSYNEKLEDMEERDQMRLFRKYGPYRLKEGAPSEAVNAYAEYRKMAEESMRTGTIID